MRYVLLLVIAALAGLAFVDHRHRADEEKRLSKVATAIVRKPVEVRCPGLLKKLTNVEGYFGKVEFDEEGRPAGYADLSPEACSGLGDFAGMLKKRRFACATAARPECDRSVERVIRAMHALTHESIHLAGIRDEAIAECYAVQTDAAVAQRLGASPALARALASYYALHLYERGPTGYQSSECRDGGKLDLRPGWALWP